MSSTITNKLKLGSVDNPVRLSYVNIIEPRAIKDGEDKKFSISLIIPKSDTKTIKEIENAISQLSKEKWGTKQPSKMWNPLKDGDIERPTDSAYADSYYLNCKSDKRPCCIDRRRRHIPLEDLDNVIYSGSYAIVIITLYAFDQSANKGIAASIDAIQKVKDGEALAGSVVDVEKEFDDLGEEEAYDPLG